MSNVIVDIDTITARYNVHKTTISEWCKKCPEMRKNKNEYDLVECDYFYIKLLEERLENVGSASKLKEVQTKNFDLRNKILEIEIAVKEKRFVDKEEIQKNLTKILTQIAFMISGIPLNIKDFEKLSRDDLFKHCSNISDKVIRLLRMNHIIWENNNYYDFQEEIDYGLKNYIEKFLDNNYDLINDESYENDENDE